MYVHELDRPWVDTPFIFQGFAVKNELDIETLQQHCDYVYIIEEQRLSNHVQSKPLETNVSKTVNIAGLPNSRKEYKDKTLVEKELGYSKAIHYELMKNVHSLMDDIRLGNKLNVTETNKAVNRMVESIIRNPDAFMWLSKLKSIDGYTYGHSIDSSALAVAFGRHLVFSKKELQDIAIGVLLCDIGKMQVPQEILTKPGRLTEHEFELVKKHVEYSVELMKQTNGISEASIEIAYTHHERYNGNGYPQGLKGEQIPIYGRMAAIVDCYDAITSERPYNRAMSPHRAVR